MPSKPFRVIPRHTPQPDQTTHSAVTPAESRPKTIIERLREREGFLDATELAGILKYQNRKRVYALPIRRSSLGGDGKGALRWDPNDVADYLAARTSGPGDKAAA